MRRFLPFLRWFKGCTLVNLRSDLISGLTVALVLIPQSMAYAQLADLPAYYGLYAAFLPPIIAAMFGSSNQLATGPVAVVSLMTSTALAPLATAGSESFIAYAILLALMVGVFQFLLGVLRLGVIVNFLSHPVVNGFTNAAALIIATSQLSKLFGVSVPSAEHHYEIVYRTIVAAVHSTHLPTLGLAALAFGIMYTLRKINRKIPDVLIAVVVTSLLSWALRYEHNAKAALENIPDSPVIETISQYNRTLDEIAAKMTERVEIGAEAQAEEEQHGKRSVEALQFNHKLSLIDLYVEEHKQRAADLQSTLQRARFVKTVSEPPEFYLIDKAPPAWKSRGVCVS